MTHKPKRVGFIGFAGCGKSTLANLMAEIYSGNVLSFAASLKEMAVKALGRPIDKAQDRKLLQELGAYGRGDATSLDLLAASNAQLTDELTKLVQASGVQRGQNFWADQVFKVVLEYPTNSFFIDDMRFQNEAARAKELDFFIVAINCDRTICEERMLRRDGKVPEGLWENISEKDWMNIRPDVIVNGNQPLDKVLANVLKAIRLSPVGL